MNLRQSKEKVLLSRLSVYIRCKDSKLGKGTKGSQRLRSFHSFSSALSPYKDMMFLYVICCSASALYVPCEGCRYLTPDRLPWGDKTLKQNPVTAVDFSLMRTFSTFHGCDALVHGSEDDAVQNQLKLCGQIQTFSYSDGQFNYRCVLE